MTDAAFLRSMHIQPTEFPEPSRPGCEIEPFEVEAEEIGSVVLMQRSAFDGMVRANAQLVGEIERHHGNAVRWCEEAAGEHRSKTRWRAVAVVSLTALAFGGSYAAAGIAGVYAPLVVGLIALAVYCLRRAEREHEGL